LTVKLAQLSSAQLSSAQLSAGYFSWFACIRISLVDYS